MTIDLYNNESPINKIDKSITLIAEATGYLRGESNIVSPSIRLESNALPVFNYAYIPDFGRYYFLKEIRAVRETIFDIVLSSDPLMSFNIGAVTGTLIETQNGGSDYLEHRNFIRNVKSKTDILSFGSGLLDSGEYILITAGG